MALGIGRHIQPHLLSLQRVQRDRNGHFAGRVYQDERIEKFIPGIDKRINSDSHNARGYDGQHHPDEHLQLVGAIHMGSLFNFQRNSFEEANQKPNGIGNREGKIYNHQPNAGVHQADFPHQDGIRHRQQNGREHIRGDEHARHGLAKAGKETNDTVGPHR